MLLDENWLESAVRVATVLHGEQRQRHHLSSSSSTSPSSLSITSSKDSSTLSLSIFSSQSSSSSSFPPLLFLFLCITLLGTICSAEISSSSSIANNGQSKMMIGNSNSDGIGDNGSQIAAGSLATSTKEVDRIEGSGNGNNMMEWSDDEDLGVEGSGSEVEGSGDTEDMQDQVVVPVITSEDIRHTDSTVRTTTTTTTSKETRLETRPSTRPPVIGKPPPPDGSTDRSKLSVLTAFVVVVWAPVLFG